MRWRGKLTLLLVVYFAGFSTAIYTLAPVEQGRWSQDGDLAEANVLPGSALWSNEFAGDFSVALHKCLAFAEGTAIKAGKYIKEKAVAKATDIQMGSD